MAPLRLAVLEADVPLPGVDARYKGYHGVFKSLLERAAASEGKELAAIATLSRHDVVTNPNPLKETTPESFAPAYPSLDSTDAILITGSKHSAFEDDPWILALVDFVRRALAHPRGIRIVGVCFGHQIVSRAMGVPVRRSEAGWEVSVIETELTDAGRQMFSGRHVLKLQQMHRDQVIGIPEGATLLASTPICPNQGFVVPGRVLTVQGHPEFNGEIMHEILEARHAIGLFPDGVYEDGMARRDDEHDGVLMARVFLRFLQQPEPLPLPSV